MAINISGILKTPQGSAIQNAEIIFEQTRTSTEVLAGTKFSVITNQTGNYSSSLGVGTYVFKVRFQDETQYRTVASNVIVTQSMNNYTLNQIIQDQSQLQDVDYDLLQAVIQARDQAAASAQAAQTSQATATTKASEASSSAQAALASKNAAQTSEANALSSKNAAQTSQTNAANSQTAAATSQTTATTKATEASNSAQAALTSKNAAQTSEANALASKNAAQASQTTASTKASEAAASQTTASTKAGEASASQTQAQQSQSDAGAAASQADDSEQQAQQSQTAAAGSQSTATAKASEASSSAQAALASKNAAQTSETNALASKNQAQTSQTNAANSQTAAAASQTTATTKAGEASTSQTNAAASQTTATTKAGEASTSQTNAAASQTTATTKAGEASSSQTAAASSQSTATTKAGEASSSQTAAASSQSTATTKATEATNSATLAQKWAANPENSVVSGGLYSALHYAAKAAQSAQTATGQLVWRGGWSAQAGTAPPTPTGTTQDFYRITQAGTILSVQYEIGDYIHWDNINSIWFKMDGTDSVTSVNGRTGAVVVTKTDVGLSAVNNWGASSQTNDASTTTYATTAGVKAAYDLAATKLTATANAVSATKLVTPRTINGTNFDGTANITTQNWGTSRNLTIGETAKAVNGSADVSWTLGEIGAAPAGYGLGVAQVQKIAQDQTEGGFWRDSALNLAGITMPYDGSPSQAFLAVNVSSNTLRFGKRVGATSVAITWYDVYSTNNKPTAADVGAVSKSGDTMTGDLTMGAQKVVGTSGGYYLNLMGGNSSPTLASSASVIIHGDSDGSGTAEFVSLRAGAGTANELKILSKTSSAGVNNSALIFNDNVVYHAGNKPTASDVGAVPLTQGGTIATQSNTNYTILADADSSTTTEYASIGAGKNTLKIGSGAASQTNAITYNNNKVYHAGDKPTADDVSATRADAYVGEGMRQLGGLESKVGEEYLYRYYKICELTDSRSMDTTFDIIVSADKNYAGSTGRYYVNVSRYSGSGDVQGSFHVSINRKYGGPDMIEVAVKKETGKTTLWARAKRMWGSMAVQVINRDTDGGKPTWVADGTYVLSNDPILNETVKMNCGNIYSGDDNAVIYTLNEYFSRVHDSGARVYSPVNKPTAADVGAVASSGDTTHSGRLTFTGDGLAAQGLRFLKSAGNDAFGIRSLNSDGNSGELEFWSSDDDVEPFVFRHYTTGADGTGSSVEWFRVDNTGAKVKGNLVYHEGNKPSAADVGAQTGYGNYNFGGNQNQITTTQFLDILVSIGAFTGRGWAARGGWTYAANQIINDTDFGNIHLAGSWVEVMGSSRDSCTIRITTATTTSGGTANATYVYVNNGGQYIPGWRRDYNTRFKPTAADVEAVSKSGDTMTGTLVVSKTGALLEGSSLTGSVKQVVGVSGNLLYFGNSTLDSGYLETKSGGTIYHRNGSTSQRIYTEGFKPTADDVGAVPLSDVNGAGGWSNVINKVPRISSAGVMEVGKYIDFHDTNNTTDFSVRMTITGGVASFSGNVEANDVYIRSDKRLKSNLEEVQGAVGKVQQLKAYSYDKHASLTDSKVVGREVGLIAQDLQKVLPEAVNEAEDTTLTISNSAVTALLVEAIKELKDEIDQLRRLINGT